MFPESHLNDLKRAVRERRLLVVAGAGVSRPAGVPLWRELLCERMPAFLRGRGDEGREVAGQMLAIADRFPLPAADVWWDWLERGEGKPAIVRFFEETFLQATRPTRTHEQIVELCRLGGPGIVTTNYDRLFELCDPTLRTRTQADSTLGLLTAPGAAKFLLKLHGTADNVDTVVLTSKQYGQQSLRQAYATVLDALQLHFTLLFVGYGGRDPDLDYLRQQLVDRFGGTVPSLYMLLDRPDPTLRESLRHMHVIVAELDGERDGYGAVNDVLDQLLAEARSVSAARPRARRKAAGAAIPAGYATALRREIRLVSFIGPPTSEALQAPEVEAVYVPVDVEAFAARDRKEAALPVEERRTTFASAWRAWRPAEHGPLVILGGPGAGKTTLLKHLGIAALDAAQGEDSAAASDLPIEPGTLPVYVRLARLGSLEHRSVDDVLARCPPQLDQHVPPRVFLDALNAGRCLLLLDGLDEAVDLQRSAALSRWIERIHRGFAKTPIVLTSRYAGYRAHAELKVPYRRLDLVPLGDADVRRFLQRYFLALEAAAGGDGEARAQTAASELAGVLSDPERGDLRRLASTPLMLLVMALLHRSGKGLPARRADLYGLCVDVLLEHWNKEKEQPYMSAAHGRAVLRPLAFWMHSQGRYSAAEEEIAPVIGPELERTPELPERTVHGFLAAIRDRFGLFAGQSQDEYAFLHPSFQEFLAAEHVKTEPAGVARDGGGKRR